MPGAHSWVRKSCNIAMEGEQTDYIGGVVDMIPDTDFPDIRNRCVIHSNHGSCTVIPREGEIVRLDVRLEDKEMLDARGRVKADMVGPNEILDVSADISFCTIFRDKLWMQTARRILSPYTLITRQPVNWWSIYVGKRRMFGKCQH
jgi:phenol 2-monooxygenase